MSLSQNGIPFASVVIEPIIATLLLIVVLLLFAKYQKKPSTPLKFLIFGILFLTFAVIASATGKILDFYSNASRVDRSYSDFTIAIAYVFSAVANIFFAFFAKHMFFSEKSSVTVIFSFLNSFTIAYILINTSFAYNVYESILGILIFHIFVSLYLYGAITRRSLLARSKTKDHVAKVGMLMIAIFGVFVMLVFIFFVMDLILGIITSSSFTIFYYFGWSSAFVASLSAYLGYVMPEWFRNLIAD